MLYVVVHLFKKGIFIDLSFFYGSLPLQLLYFNFIPFLGQLKLLWNNLKSNHDYKLPLYNLFLTFDDNFLHIYMYQMI